MAAVHNPNPVRIDSNNFAAEYPSAAHPAQADAGAYLFSILYPYNPSAQIDNADRGRMTAESNYVRGASGKYIPKPAATAAEVPEPTAPYQKAVTKLREVFTREAISVGQRNWAATRGSSIRHYLATLSIYLCACVIIYEPVERIAVLAHVDEYQGYDTLLNILRSVFPDRSNNNPLSVYFIAGKTDKTAPLTQRNLTGLLNALYTYNQDFNAPKVILRAFDVIGRPHGADIIFDAANGNFYCESFATDSAVSGQPLDTLARSWPSGDWWAATDWSTISENSRPYSAFGGLDNQSPGALSNSALAADICSIRCQWNDATDNMRTMFIAKVNRKISELTVEKTLQAAGVTVAALNALAVGVAADVMRDMQEELVARLQGLARPMMLEQSLKAWVYGNDPAILTTGTEAGDAKRQTRKNNSLTAVLANFLRAQMNLAKPPTKYDLVQQFNATAVAWAERGEFKVEGEGKF